MNTALDSVNALFDAVFPPMAKPQAPDIWDRLAADDAKREAHVAKVTPELARLYAITPDKLRRAYEDVSLYADKTPALIVATATRDPGEIGRLVLAFIDARIKEMAEDDAAEDGYRVVPERPL